MKLSPDQVRQFRANVREVILQMQERGLDVPETIKRRDRREPAADEKELLEDRITRTMKRHWSKQRARVEQYIQVYHPSRKDLWLPDDLLGTDDELEAALMRLLLGGATRGAEMALESIGLGIDWTLVNGRAAEWARLYVGDMIRQVDTRTLDIVRQSVSDFIETPGMTMGDLIDRLPFTEQRARSIAVTETTRSYAQGQLAAGDELKEQFPDVGVTKTWFTNNDDKVCLLCGPLDGVEIDFDELFYEPESEYNDGNAPRHVNCRCWQDVGTRIKR